MSKLDFEQRQRLENDVLPAVIDDPEYAAATIVRLEAEFETLQKERDDLAQSLIEKYIRQEKESEKLLGLLSHWYECWNDGIANPDGDVLDDTAAALAGEDKQC